MDNKKNEFVSTGQLKGRVAIITGGGSGIGEGICMEFASQGAKIAIADINIEKADLVAQKINNNGGECIAKKVDATIPKQIKTFVEEILKKFKNIDILVNCAGYNEFSPIEKVTNEQFENLLRTNLFSQWFFCKEVIPVMMKKKYGKIVNIGSGCGILGIPKALPYTTAKHGVIGLTRALAIDLGPSFINVNCITPGTVLTPLLEKACTKKFCEITLQRYPIPRLGIPKDIAKAALFLVSAASDWITGVVLPVDGGLTCCIRAHHME